MPNKSAVASDAKSGGVPKNRADTARLREVVKQPLNRNAR
jgi:hypothetical protein